jgi:hypothetical protein
MTNITNMNLLHISAPGFHPQGGFHIKGVQAQHINPYPSNVGNIVSS